MKQSNQILITLFDVNNFWLSVEQKDTFCYKIPPSIDHELLQQIKDSLRPVTFYNPKFYRVRQNDIVVYNNKVWLASEISENLIGLESPTKETSIIHTTDYPIPIYCSNDFGSFKRGDKIIIQGQGEVEILKVTETMLLVKNISTDKIAVINNSTEVDIHFFILSSMNTVSLNNCLDNTYQCYQDILMEIYNDFKAFETSKENYNKTIQYLRVSFDNGEYESIEQAVTLLLSKPQDMVIELFYYSSDVSYNQSIKTLIVDYVFNFEKIYRDIPAVNKGQLLFEDTIYQLVLKLLHNIFIFNSAQNIDSIVFNGYIKHKDKATGHDTCSCILSLHTTREKFLSINLHYVDPKTCFRSLKGISSANLVDITPVNPILIINRNDKRFIEPTSVIENIDTSFNLATMKWEDFEMLVREIFEKEFSSNGGEVKVTRASRDGGIDAIAFDPDPLRGGKIVIQAKRYTNTVEVSAVRDLYGTMIHEGATKGILVTTADYGKDAFEFAKDKPITLLNGGHLLFLLEKHGHKARIDLKEAKKNLLQNI